MTLSRTRRWTVRGLLAVGTILAVLSIFAVWADRQVLDADHWADTSTAMLADPAIQTQVSAYLVDQVYANVDVTGQIASALPPRLRPLAGEAAGGLRQVGERVVNRALERPRFQQAWKEANRLTARQFINIAEGKSGAVTASGNAVVLDLRVVLVDLAARLGLPRSLVDKIPAGAGRIKILSSNQVTAVQDGASALNGLAFVLPPLALVLFALAVWIARGRRRRTLLFVGFDLVLAGALVLLARTLIGQQVVDSLATTDAVRPAAESAWSIGTGILREVAQATIVIGIPVIVAAWLAGPTRVAVALRRAAAPWLRERPGLAYGTAAALVLLVVAWGPIPATRMVVPVLIMAALVALGVHVLREQVATEFPRATTEGAGAALRAALARGRHAVLHPRTASNGTTAPAVVAEDDGRLQRLERLAALRDAGALTPEEFATEKASVLAGDPTPSGGPA